MTITELPDFLLARIAEDEDDARAASRVREARKGDAWEVWRGQHGLDSIVRSGQETELAEVVVEAARHVARHDPARVLAECEARRRLVEAHSLSAHPLGFRVNCATCGAVKRPACLTLRILAQPYADHPDHPQAAGGASTRDQAISQAPPTREGPRGRTNPPVDVPAPPLPTTEETP